MKKILNIVMIVILVLSLIGCKGNFVVNKKSINKPIAASTIGVGDANPYIQILGYKKVNDIIKWKIKFLQNTKNIGDIIICILIYDSNGNPIQYQKSIVPNRTIDELRLIKNKDYPINTIIDFEGQHDILTNYSKFKYSIQTVYYLSSDEKTWKEWTNPNLDNWIKVNKDKY